MRKLLLLVFTVILSINLFSQCPVKGDKDNLKFQHIDSLKNRNSMNKVIDSSVSLNSILATGNDEKRFNSNQYVHLTGYVILVKDGDEETCNCHSKKKEDLDIHIELALNQSDKGSQSMIVEINRFTKSLNSNYTTSNLRKLVGKKVEIEGWMFFDQEHWQNAVNTNPTGTNNWRMSCWEIHPCMLIKEVR